MPFALTPTTSHIFGHITVPATLLVRTPQRRVYCLVEVSCSVEHLALVHYPSSAGPPTPPPPAAPAHAPRTGAAPAALDSEQPAAAAEAGGVRRELHMPPQELPEPAPEVPELAEAVSGLSVLDCPATESDAIIAYCARMIVIKVGKVRNT